MTEPTTLQEIIERIEKATVPDREIDALITVALDLRPDWLRKSNGELWVDMHDKILGPIVRFKDVCIAKRNNGNPPIGDYPCFSESIDAALTLIPEGWEWALYCENGEYRVEIGDPMRNLFSEASTPALALASAALRARLTTEFAPTPTTARR